MLRYIQLFFGFIIFAALISCSVPATSSRKVNIYESEEALFKDNTWSASTGNGYIFYLSMKNGQMGMTVISTNGGGRVEYKPHGKSSLSGNTWKGKFQHPTDSNVIYDVMVEIESEFYAKASFVSSASGYPTFRDLHMGKS